MCHSGCMSGGTLLLRHWGSALALGMGRGSVSVPESRKHPIELHPFSQLDEQGYRCLCQHCQSIAVLRQV